MEIVAIKLIAVLAPVLLAVAFLTLIERKVLGLIGLRLGPYKVSVLGILQPITDALKLSNKQVNILTNFRVLFYYFFSLAILLRAMMLWTTVPLNPSLMISKFRIILILIAIRVSSLSSIFCGWRTFRKYSLLGSVRTLSQLISYEAVLYLCLFMVFFIFERYRTTSFVGSACTTFFIPICLIVWLPSVLAEINRNPYDFSEGERELVRGYNVEFSSRAFTIIFLAEYSNIIFFSIFTSLIFFTANRITFFVYLFFFIIWIRSVLPRYRFDKLMALCWKFFIPFMTIVFFIYLI